MYTYIHLRTTRKRHHYSSFLLIYSNLLLKYFRALIQTHAETHAAVLGLFTCRQRFVRAKCWCV